MTVVQMRYLVALASGENGKTVSLAAVARRFGVNRSTVSRALSACIDEGILDENLSFTSYGKSFIIHFNQRFEALVYWLVRNGVDQESSEKDALNIMMNCSEETISLMEKGGRLL